MKNALRKKIAQETIRFHCNMILKTTEENKSLKTAKRNLMFGRKKILALMKKSRKIIV